MGIETILFVLLLVLAVPLSTLYLRSRRKRGKPVSPGKEKERRTPPQ